MKYIRTALMLMQFFSRVLRMIFIQKIHIDLYIYIYYIGEIYSSNLLLPGTNLPHEQKGILS